jgi:hypothetical protein
MKTEIEQAREIIKEYRKGNGQSQLSTDCIIQLMISHAKEQFDHLLFCGKCGNKRELIVETDINSGRTCKSRLCTGK